MPKRERRSPNAIQGQLLRPQEELQRVLQALVTMSQRIGKPFSEERMQQFSSDLNNYPVEGIEWAMDNWGRNAKALPTLADILAMLRTWLIPSAGRKRDEPGCEQCEQGWIVTNPEAKKCDWVMTPCACLRDPSFRVRPEQRPLTIQERVDLNEWIRKIEGIQPNRFPNGNPRLNLPLVQARALQTVR